MIKKFLTLVLVFTSSSFVYASAQMYTISVCMTLSLENALVCKKNIFDNMDGKVFIVKDKDEKYYTYLNIFDNKEDARRIINSASTYVKKQKPYVKSISEDVIALYSKKKIFIDLNDEVKQNKIQEIYILKDENKDNQEQIDAKKEEFELVSSFPKIEELKLVESYPFAEGQKLADDNFQKEPAKIQKEELASPSPEPEQRINPTNTYSQEELKNIDEIRQISMDEFDKADEGKKLEKNEDTKEAQKKEIIEIKMNNNKNESSIFDYEEIIIEVDSETNSMVVRAKVDNQLQDIKTYKVSTGKKNIKKPFGLGRISKISLNPIWYPTEDTIKSFRKRGINLPSVVPPGDKYNYMGAAKINLTHIVEGKNTFRIHGTLNENTIGTNESAGCIRMKNSDVIQLVSLLNNFAGIKSLNDVKVILK